MSVGYGLGCLIGIRRIVDSCPMGHESGFPTTMEIWEERRTLQNLGEGWSRCLGKHVGGFQKRGKYFANKLILVNV